MQLVRLLMGDMTAGNFEAMAPLLSSDVVASWEEPPEVVVCRGPRELAARSRAFQLNWRRFQVEPEEFVELDPCRILVVLQTHGQGALSGAVTQSRTHLVFRFTRERISEFHWFFDRDRALAAAGSPAHAARETSGADAPTPDRTGGSRYLTASPPLGYAHRPGTLQERCRMAGRMKVAGRWCAACVVLIPLLAASSSAAGTPRCEFRVYGPIEHPNGTLYSKATFHCAVNYRGARARVAIQRRVGGQWVTVGQTRRTVNVAQGHHYTVSTAVPCKASNTFTGVKVRTYFTLKTSSGRVVLPSQADPALCRFQSTSQPQPGAP
jgi:ketosteroid isomerase-like protein